MPVVDLSTIGIEGINAATNNFLKDAQTRQLNAIASGQELENESANIENQIEQDAVSKISKIAKGENTAIGSGIISDNGDPSKAAPLEAIGQLMINAGAVKRGSDYLKTGVNIRKQEDEMLSAVEERKAKRLDSIVKTGDIVSKTIGVARNQSEWQWGIKQLEQRPDIVEILGPENFEAIKNMEYDPNVAAYFNEQAMSAKDRASLQMQVQGEERQTRSALDLAQYRKTLVQTNQANLEMRRREFELRAKADGKDGEKSDKPAGAPSESELKSAKAAVANLVFDGKIPSENSEEYVAFSAGAQDIASRAKEMVKYNKALSWNDAVQRATIQSQVAGDWEVLKGATHWYKADDPDKKKFRPKGSTPADAQAMPTEKSKLKIGAYYNTARGIAKWNGTGFVKDTSE